MLKLGNLNINKAYIGDTEIKKMYLGDTIIFDKSLWVEFPFNGGTEAELRIQTVDGSDWQVDWGDGIIETYPSSNSVVDKNYGSSFTGIVKIKGNISYLRSTKGAFDWTNVSEFTSLDYLHLQGNPFTGDMTGVSGLTSLTYLYLNGNGFTGDMSGVSNLTSLTTLRLYGAGFTGDMTGVSGLTSLDYLYLYINFTGDMSGVSGLTSLTTLYLHGNGFTGDMSGVSNLTSLTFLRLVGNGFTGDMTGVSGLTSLDYLYLGGNVFTLTYSTFTANLGTLFLRLQTGELSNPADIDQLFIDLDAVATAQSGSIDLRSTGAAAPTAASEVARNSLVSKGRTILTN